MKLESLDSPHTPPPTPNERQAGYQPADPLREDYKPISRKLTIGTVAELILKSPGNIIHIAHHGNSHKLAGLCLIISLVSLASFGLTVGSFSGGAQLWAAPLKITCGVFFSTLLCLPSLFVFSCLAGADSNMPRIANMLIGLITVTSLLLIAFAPVSWIFSQSTESIVFMGYLNIAFWLIAVHCGIQYLNKSVALLNGKPSKHLKIWTVIFIVVSLQMTATLRPILGRSDKLIQNEKEFFLTHWLNHIARG